MSIKQLGGVFGRNPTFNDVTIEGELILNDEVFTGLDFQGSWNASTNTPTLASGVGTTGEFYIVSVAGTTNLDGITNWGVGDWAMFSGSAWQRVEGNADGNFVNLSVSNEATMNGLTVDGNPVINGTSPQLFLQTGASNTNWQIAAQENVANAFEISSGAADASAPDDTYTKRLVVQNTGDISFYDTAGTTPKLSWDASAESLTLSGTGGLTVSSDSGGPVYLQDSNATATYNISELSNNAGNFGLQTRDSSGVFVSTDYQIVKNASGADYHRWFTQGIERLRIDSSGNLLLGNPPIGSIGTAGGELFIAFDGTTDSGLRFRDSGEIIPANSGGAGTNGVSDLGSAGFRFKSLYLSDGAYLGGTAAANKLDDYEGGTWTPVLIGTTVAGTGTYTSQDGKYTKVGNLVTFQMGLNWSAHTGTGTMQIQGLPFTTSATGIGAATVYVSDVASSAGTFIQCFLSGSTTDIRLRQVATGGGSAAGVAMDTAGQMFISGHYYV